MRDLEMVLVVLLKLYQNNLFHHTPDSNDNCSLHYRRALKIFSRGCNNDYCHDCKLSNFDSIEACKTVHNRIPSRMHGYSIPFHSSVRKFLLSNKLLLTFNWNGCTFRVYVLEIKRNVEWNRGKKINCFWTLKNANAIPKKLEFHFIWKIATSSLHGHLLNDIRCGCYFWCNNNSSFSACTD